PSLLPHQPPSPRQRYDAHQVCGSTHALPSSRSTPCILSHALGRRRSRLPRPHASQSKRMKSQTTKPWTTNSPHTQSVSAQYSYEHDYHPRHGPGRRSPPAQLARCPHCLNDVPPCESTRMPSANIRTLLVVISSRTRRIYPLDAPHALHNAQEHMQSLLCSSRRHHPLLPPPPRIDHTRLLRINARGRGRSGGRRSSTTPEAPRLSRQKDRKVRTLGASPAAPRHLRAYLRSLLFSPPILHPCNSKATLVQHMQVCLARPSVRPPASSSSYPIHSTHTST
ncbi:hypothetical protein C8J57DRAFT_1620651, partial [Mycena rebaudengoi]